MNPKKKETLKRIYIGVVLLGAVSTIITAISAPRSAGFLTLYPGLIYGIYYLKQLAQKYNRMETTVATVIGYSEYRDEGTLMYQPRFEFTVQGQVHVACGKMGSSLQFYTVGSKVNIRYNPDDPQEVAINRGENRSWHWWVIYFLRFNLFTFSATMIFSAIGSLF